MSLQQQIHPERTARVADAAGMVAGATAGALAAPTVASATGATVIPIVTALGKLIGLSLLTVTPVIWIAGAAVAGGLVGLAATRLIKGIGGDRREARIDAERRQP